MERQSARGIANVAVSGDGIGSSTRQPEGTMHQDRKHVASVPVPPARSSRIIRRALVTARLAGALTAGAVAFAGTASAQELPSHTSLVASTSQPLPTWCPFGTHGGKHGGCRVGSIGNDVRDHGYQYATIGGCGAAGIATGVVNPALGAGVGMGCGAVFLDDPAN
jgi:hypothetical protein